MTNRDKLPQLLLLFPLIGALAGCARSISSPPTPTGDGETPPSPSISPAYTPQPGSGFESTPPRTLPPGLEPVSPTEDNPVVGEVPEGILDEIIFDLRERTGAAREDIHILRAESVVWNDGSLACPRPGEFYIQMMINGYWVVLKVDDIEYDYRVNDSGYFTLCEGKGSPAMPPRNTVDNPLVMQARQDLADRLGVPLEKIEVLSFEAVVWPDASLGCPQPGMEYIQVPKDGALIRLSAEGQEYNYHSGGNRGVFLCENSLKSTQDSLKINPVPPLGSTDE